MKNRGDDDYSFQAIESRMRKAKGAPLTEAELATIKEQADEIAEAEKAYEAAKEAEEIAAENAEVHRLCEAMVKEIEQEKSEASGSNTDHFGVGLLAILLVPSVWLHRKTKLSPFVAGLFSTVPILILLLLAGYGIYRLLKWIL